MHMDDLDDLEDQRPRQAVGAIEERIQSLANVEGFKWGSTYVGIWSPTLATAEAAWSSSLDSVRPHVPVPAKLWRVPLFWASVGLFISGVSIMVWGVQTGEGAAFGLWLVNSFIWGWALSRAADAVERSDKQARERLDWLRRVFYFSAVQRVSERRAEARNYDPDSREDYVERAGGTERFVAPAPLPQPFGVSHEGAERLIAHWMKHLGEPDAEETQYVNDGGIDVASVHYIAQVKNYTGSVDVASVRELAGVAYTDGRKPLFFTSGSYSSGAVLFANQAGIALFQYDAVAGNLVAVNELAKRVIERGL